MLLLRHAPTQPRQGHQDGRRLLAQTWAEVFPTPMPPVEKTPQGRPCFPGNPCFFSISHTPNHVFVALSDRNVSIDAEELTRQVNPRLAQKILSPGEFSQYQAAQDKNKALLSFWVLKEAQAKFTGEGLRGYPSHTDFSLTDPRLQEQFGCITAIFTEERNCDHAF